MIRYQKKPIQIQNRVAFETKSVFQMQQTTFQKDTPHSELRFRTELNQKTSNSGHSNLLHIIESTNTVRPALQRIQIHTLIQKMLLWGR